MTTQPCQAQPPAAPPAALEHHLEVVPGHQELHSNHLTLAFRLNELADQIEHDAGTPVTCPDEVSYLRGYRAALLDLGGHLMAGDYLPNGMLLSCSDLRAG